MSVLRFTLNLPRSNTSNSRGRLPALEPKLSLGLIKHDHKDLRGSQSSVLIHSYVLNLLLHGCEVSVTRWPISTEKQESQGQLSGLCGPVRNQRGLGSEDKVFTLAWKQILVLSQFINQHLMHHTTYIKPHISYCSNAFWCLLTPFSWSPV